MPERAAAEDAIMRSRNLSALIAAVAAVSAFAAWRSEPPAKAESAAESIRNDWIRSYDANAKETAAEQCRLSREIERRGVKPGIPSARTCHPYYGDMIARSVSAPRLRELRIPARTWLPSGGGVCVADGWMLRAYSDAGDGEGRAMVEASSLEARIVVLGQVGRDARCEEPRNKP